MIGDGIMNELKFASEKIFDDIKHIKIREYKKINRKLEENLNVRNYRFDIAMRDFD